ncbi:MAG: hypothetical protein P0116_02655 [Candidatus Nitrosocosmicus sp.]|nr:hypothetical protein [Candidatus Nitrosocosmicus sp.]
MQKTKTVSFDPFKNGVDSFVVQLYTMCTSNPDKETWSLDEIYEARYPNSTQDKSKNMVILKNSLKWLKSKEVIEYPNNNSIKLIKYRLSSLIDGV